MRVYIAITLKKRNRLNRDVYLGVARGVGCESGSVRVETRVEGVW